MYSHQENIAPASRMSGAHLLGGAVSPRRKTEAAISAAAAPAVNSGPGTVAAGIAGGAHAHSSTVPADQLPPKAVITDKQVDKATGLEVQRRYFMHGFLGKGGFARVFQAQSEASGMTYACKVIAKSSLQRKRALQKLKSEIRIHRSLKHENVISFVKCFEDRDNVYLMLELCPNESMTSLLRTRSRLTEEETRYYMVQLVEGVRFMHENYVIHRDLKLGNLMLSADMRIKIGDFGLATKLTEPSERRRTICGTPNYIAPEILTGGNNGHSFEVDVWSIGVILYTLLIGRPPFETRDIKSTYQRIKDNQYSFPEDRQISEKARNLIQRILNPVPEHRPSLLEILEHPFFTTEFIPTSVPLNSRTLRPTFDAPAVTAAPAPMPMMSTTTTSSAAAEVAAAIPVMPVAPRTPRRTALVERLAAGMSPKATSDAAAGASSSVAPQTLASRKRERDSAFSPAAGGHMRRKISLTEDGALRLEGAQVQNEGEEMEREQQEDSEIDEQLADNPAKAEAPPMREADSIEDCDTVELLAERIAAAASRPKHATPGPAIAAAPSKWIVKWLDYSTKYGLGYRLNDGTVGVLFNDQSVLVQDSDGRLEYQTAEGHRSVATLHSHPAELLKKVGILKNFAKSLNRDSASSQYIFKPEVIDEETSQSHLTTVVRWTATTHAIAFKMSGGLFQINFFDHTKLMVQLKPGVIMYLDKEKRTHSLPLAAAYSHESAPADLAHKLNYTRDLLEKWAQKHRN